MRTWAITKRVLKELFRDKKTLALMFIAPLIVLALMNYIFNVNTTTNVTIGTVEVSQSLKHNLNQVQHVHVKTYQSSQSAKAALKKEQVDNIIVQRKNKLVVTYANVDAGKTKLAKSALQVALNQKNINQLKSSFQTLQKVLPPTLQQPTVLGQSKKLKIHNAYNYGTKDSTFFDKLMPILMAAFVFFFVFLISGMALLSERTSGTLNRLLATPVKRSEIVWGYMLSYGLIAILQTILIVLFTVGILKVQVVGSLWLVLLITLLLALVALSSGIFMSTFAKSEFQMMQFIPVIVIPQIFFSGIVPLTSMAKWAQWLSDILPLKYASEALTNVIMKGFTLNQISGDLLVLVVFLLALTVGNIIGLKRYRKV